MKHKSMNPKSAERTRSIVKLVTNFSLAKQAILSHLPDLQFISVY